MARKDRPQHRHTRPQAAATGPSGQRVQGSMGMTLNEDDEDDDDADSDDDDDDDDDDDVSCKLCKLNGVACKALNLFIKIGALFLKHPHCVAHSIQCFYM